MSLSGDLLSACENGDLPKVKVLFKRGAGLFIGNLPLSAAVQYGRLDVVKYLVKQGANIYEYDDWILRCAVNNRHLNVVNFLREVAGSRYKCHTCLVKPTCLELCPDFQDGSKWKKYTPRVIIAILYIIVIFYLFTLS